MQPQKIYGNNFDVRQHEKRVEKLSKDFKKRFGASHEHVISSPGRAEIVGNHTDHQHGKVLVASISCDILALVRKRDDGIIEVCSEGYSEIYLKVGDTSPREQEKGKSVALIRGVMDGVMKKGYLLGGFSMVTDSTVPKGAGVSSSAAFEVLIAEIFNVLYLGGKLTAVEKAQISQYAENAYFGKPCGLLDQSGIAIGGMNMIDFANPEKPEIVTLPPIKGQTLVITNTGGSHANLTEHYGAIRDEMKSVARFFGKEYLREVDEIELYSSLGELRKAVSERAILRAMHFFDECRRVDIAASSLYMGNMDRFLEQVTQSGESSNNYLQNTFVPGSSAQPIALAVEYSKKILCGGAVRVHGGGFAGTILAIVPDGQVEVYLKKMKSIFGEENVFATVIREYGTCEIDF